MFPEIGDIWMDNEDGECFLFLSNPSVINDYVHVKTLDLRSGKISERSFGYDERSGTLAEWWTKVG